MRTLTRYYLFQVPGWALTAVLAAVLHAWLGLPVWVALTVLGVVVLKDVIFYPFLRRAYQLEASGAARLVGLRGVARGTLDPNGYVYVNGELWRAKTEAGAPPIPGGADVRVVQGNRMTLTVAED
ncbi:MAG: NfeD family protein [Deltaproteobacteria bacterium]|nr:NfeD family protein [Deltaproteobacteria bacterium]MDE0213482.1 NfeD family protein [Deltaproteobacteria bacterium]